MNIVLTRDTTYQDCTLGVLTVQGTDLSLQTLELPWVADPQESPGGAPNVSRVPAGVYDLALHNSPRHPYTFALQNAELGVCADPDPALPLARTDCLIHAANLPGELEGCIALGLTRAGHEVLESVAALTQFKAAVPWVAGHTLTVVDAA